MTEKERKELLNKMEQVRILVGSSKEEARKFLIKVGIITEKGNLRKPYRKSKND